MKFLKDKNAKVTAKAQSNYQQALFHNVSATKMPNTSACSASFLSEGGRGSTHPRMDVRDGEEAEWRQQRTERMLLLWVQGTNQTESRPNRKRQTNNPKSNLTKLATHIRWGMIAGGGGGNARGVNVQPTNQMKWKWRRDESTQLKMLPRQSGDHARAKTE